jgi:hypothetical protein
MVSLRNSGEGPAGIALYTQLHLVRICSDSKYLDKVLKRQLQKMLDSHLQR